MVYPTLYGVAIEKRQIRVVKNNISIFKKKNLKT